MEHFKDEWFHEIRLMREALISGKNFDLSSHAYDERMDERKISISEIAEVILNGEIMAGFDVGTFPNYRNPDILRTVVGKTSAGRILSIGVAMKSDNTFTVTTIYEGVTKWLLPKLEKENPEIFRELEMAIN